MKNSTTPITAIAKTLGASAAHAQACEPTWGSASGIPGIAKGCIAPVTPWKDGKGEKLFVVGCP